MEEEEEAESRDMAEAEMEMEMEGSPRGAPSEPSELSEPSVGALGVAVLSSAATLCCGVHDVANKKPHADEAEKSSVKGETAGTKVKPSERCFSIFFCNLPPALFAPSAPEVSSQSRQSDVCAVAGSAACREEEGCGRP